VTVPGAERAEDELSGSRLAGALLCGLLVLVAIGLEIIAGQGGNSPAEARYARFVPLGWPQPARVAWWVMIAGAAAGHRLLLDDRQGWRRRVLAAAAATPFAVFAVGVGVGASWSTWH
jgi:nitroreductase